MLYLYDAYRNQLMNITRDLQAYQYNGTLIHVDDKTKDFIVVIMILLMIY